MKTKLQKIIGWTIISVVVALVVLQHFVPAVHRFTQTVVVPW